MTTKSLSKPITTIEEITPEIAAEMLKDNRSNRKLRPTVWRRFMRDMITSSWDMGTGMIVFDKDGRLIDGQHRLTAVVESGVTIQSVVLRGVESEAQLNIDAGFKRQLKDHLEWRGEVNATTLSAGIRMDWRLIHNQIFVRNAGYGALSFHESLQHLDDNPGLRPACTLSHTIKSKLGIPPAAAVTFIHRIRLVDTMEATRFLDEITSGESMAKGQATYATRTWCLNKRNRAATGQKPSSDLYAAVLIKGWNAWVTGKPVEYLVFRQGGSKPEPFPHILDMEGLPMPLVSEMDLKTMSSTERARLVSEAADDVTAEAS